MKMIFYNLTAWFILIGKLDWKCFKLLTYLSKSLYNKYNINIALIEYVSSNKITN